MNGVTSENVVQALGLAQSTTYLMNGSKQGKSAAQIKLIINSLYLHPV